jgi:hypothetical protein
VVHVSVHPVLIVPVPPCQVVVSFRPAVVFMLDQFAQIWAVVEWLWWEVG